MGNAADYTSFQEAMEALADVEETLSSPVLYALSGTSSAETQLFRRQWSEIPVERRRQAMSLLVESAEANFELDFNALFRTALQDADADVRTLAVEGLWEDEEATLVTPLVHILRHDSSPAARAAAASSLGRFVLMAELEELEERYGKLVRGALLETIQDEAEPVEVRRRVVEAISYLTDDCVHDIIAAAYKDTDEAMRLSAVFAMGRSADPVWSELALGELSSPNPAMRYEAARACGEIEVKEAVPSLIRLASDSDREVQAAAIAALGQIGGKQARRALERLGGSDDEVVSLAAEDALAELKLGSQPLDLFVYDPHAEHDAVLDEESDLED